MKRICMAFLGLLFIWTGAAQTKPVTKRPATTKAPSKSDMDRMMEDAMKGMSKEEQEEMRKMMKNAQPALEKMANSTADYPEFTDNQVLVPARDQARISTITRKIFTPAEMLQQTQLLYTKLMTNAPADQKSIISQVIAKEKKADVLMAAASTAFLMGHRPAAAGLAMKAVLADPASLVYQNNLAAILTQTGYPEKAIPYLNTLRQVKPGNSTLNNNLGYAWFYLGEIDSASRYIQMALARNPAHAEAQLCAGIIAESHGDDTEATHGYEEAFTETASHQPAKLLQNKRNTNPAEKVDYQRLIHSITVFEYFDSSWAKLPTMENNVNAWEKNRAVIIGLDSMHEKLSREIQGFRDQANQEMEALLKSDNSKNGDKFATEMMTASLEGLNMMSKPALYIIAILSEEYKRFVMEAQDSGLALGNFIEAQRKIRNDVPHDAKCPLYDAKSNDYMAAVNPRLHKYSSRNLERFRVWINAWCTWRWFIVGNVKKTVTVELLEWELAFLDMRRDALRTFELEQPHCRSTDEPKGETAKELEYYYTDCLPEVKLPFSISTLEASASAAKMSNNAFNIKYTGQPIPNATLTYGISGKTLSEPGLFSNPGIKTSEGGITPLGINYADASADDELVPLPKLPPTSEDDLTPLPKITKDPEDLVPLDKNLLKQSAELKALVQAKLARMTLNKKLKRNCYEVGLGTLDFHPTRLVVGIGEISFDDTMEYNEETGKWEKRKGKIVVGIGEISFEELPLTPEQAEPSILKTVISNGMELLKETAKTVVNLFK